MLVNFSVKNFLSFDEAINFSMVPGRAKLFSDRIESIGDDLKVLKFSAIYGANASGKSNFIKAIYEFGRLVIKGSHQTQKKYSFLGKKDSNKNPTSFEVGININGQNIIYGFEYIYDSNSFSSEWLYVFENGKEKPIFERRIPDGVFELYFDLDKSDSERLNVYKEDFKQEGKKLFVSFVWGLKKKINNKNIDIIASIQSWIFDDLEVTFPDNDLTTPDYFLEDSKIEELSCFLKKYGTGIEKLSLSTMNDSEVKEIIPTKIIDAIEERAKTKDNSITYLRSKTQLIFVETKNKTIKYSKVLFVHKINGNNVEMNLARESDGTIRIMELAPVVLTKNKNKTFFVDEFDRCLHPLLSVMFIKDFLKKANQGSNNQLIITTHESLLMDLELLRRDEIWFVEKKNGFSEMYSLEDFQERFDRKVDKQYLSGRYGAVPLFQNTMGGIMIDED